MVQSISKIVLGKSLWPFVFSLILMAGNLKAQDTLSASYAEQKTYELYLEHKWPQLTDLGKKAIKKGYDYYYMRMRMGIAYYEQKDYCGAEPHFSKALQFNSADTLALEYLYYCYLFTGQSEQARWLSKKFDTRMLKKTGLDTRTAVDLVMLEAGTKITDSTAYYDRSKKSNSNFYDPPTYFQFGLGHFIKDRVAVFHALTIFNQNSFVGQLKQKQYYLKVTVSLSKGWMVAPSFHLVHTNFSTTVNLPPGPQGPMPGPPLPPRTKTTEDIATYYVGSLSVQKFAGRFLFSVTNTASNISNVTQYLHAGGVSCYLLGNSRFVIGCTGYLHTVDAYSTLHSSVQPYLYCEPFKRFSVKLHALFNEGKNIIEDNGYLVNNSPDLTQWRTGALFNFYLGKRISLYALYQFENKLENVQKFHYKYNVILAGIKITPGR